MLYKLGSYFFDNTVLNTRLRFQLSKVSIFLSFAKFTVLLSIAESSSSAIQGQSQFLKSEGNWADERVQAKCSTESDRAKFLSTRLTVPGTARKGKFKLA